MRFSVAWGWRSTCGRSAPIATRGVSGGMCYSVCKQRGLCVSGCQWLAIDVQVERPNSNAES